jgi:hypothetical protein
VNKQQRSWLIHWTISWFSPGTEPGPHWSGADYTGWPRDILEARLPRGQSLELPPDMKPGCGYCTVWRGPIPPADYVPRKLSIEAKQKMRRGNLKRRVEKAAPLFAQQIVKKELENNPEYFGG